MANIQIRPPAYELFIAPLAVVLSPKRYEQVQFAYFVSKYGHAKQEREDGTRYFDHPKAATWIYIDELGGRDPHTVIITLLHDIPEDTYLLSWYRIALNFGVKAALDLRALTKLPKGKESTEEYLERIIKRGPRAIVAKLCDRLHNLRTMKARPTEKILAQIEETRQYHLPMLLAALRTHGDPWAGYANMMESKIEAALQALS